MTKISIEDIILGKDSVLCEITDVTSAYAVLGKPDVHEVGDIAIWLDYGALSISFDLDSKTSMRFSITMHPNKLFRHVVDTDKIKNWILDYQRMYEMDYIQIKTY